MTLRGSSGAHFSERSFVIKSGTDRVAKQGRWLQVHACQALPQVAYVGIISYAMECLTDVPVRLIGELRLLAGVHSRLERFIWSQPAEVKFDPDALTAKLLDLPLDEIASMPKRLAWLNAEIEWDKLRTGLTHGDPTLENTMLRGTDLVLIDPTPATLAVPDIIAVDLGKMLQSVIGWEHARYGWPKWTIPVACIRNLCADDNEWQATRYWCVVHLLRAMPYMPSLKPKLWELIDDVLDLV